MEYFMQYLRKLTRGVHVRSMFSALLILFLTASSALANDLFESTPNSRAPQLVIKAPMGNGRSAVITAEEFPESTPSQIKELLLDQRLQGKDVLLTTDQPEVIEAATEAISGEGDRRLLRIIPIGKLANVSQKIASGFKNYYKNARTTLQTDRIGLTVLSITAGVDTMIWVHSASLDIHQKTAMVLMNFVMAASFGLDRELWQKINSPVKRKLIQVFDKFVAADRLANAKVVAAAFTSNFLLGIGIQLTRTGLLSLDHISHAVMTTDFWTHAMQISGMVTATAFAWSETFGNIDVEKNPVAKMMMKRLSEMRGIIMCQLASISMVMQPHVYGHMPVYTFIVHGTIGLVVFFNAHKIVDWLESNATVNRVYKRVQTFENFINRGLSIGSGAEASGGSCRALFAH